MQNKPFKLSVKVVILDKSGNCLLIRRSETSKHGAGKWDFPGGKADPGEDFESALLREVTEETGLAVRLEHVVGAAESETPVYIVAYLFMEGRRTGGDVRLSREHDAFRWVPVSELPEMDLSPQFAAFAREYARKRVSSAEL